ncbi:MAG TPA: hypothetical protein VJ625_09980, partial [Propionibacteriaceae bacterium]|nr:hypothetical protein [Propionibacteriaceae bacterium]
MHQLKQVHSTRIGFLIDGDVFTDAVNGSCQALLQVLVSLKFVPVDVVAVRGFPRHSLRLSWDKPL